MEIIYGFKGTSQDMVAKKATQLFLLAKRGDHEVIKQKIAEQKLFALKPSPNPEIFEFVYILEGRIRQKRDGKILEEGDYIIIHGLKDEVYFETLSPVSLLYFTNSPVFYEQKSRIQQLMKLAKEVEEKDQYTEEHSFRLQEIVTKVGRYLGFDDESLFYQVYAAVLHDIGKTNIPEEILRKPDRLTEEEWELVKNHPIWGRDIILETLGEGDFAKVAEIVAQHHERYDGKGYPFGLKGSEILLEAQILSIADAYDAMTTTRPYQAAFTPEEACQRLRKERGGQFSAEVVDAFLAVEKFLRKEGISSDT